MRDRFTVLNGLRAHYIEWGEPNGPAVLMLHGLRSYAQTFEPLAARLADRYRVIALDARGRGDSDWDPAGQYYTASYVADLEQFTDHLGLDRFVLLGHSMGGATAYVYAARHPERVRGAVIEDIGPGSSISGAGAERIKREVAETPAEFASLDAARAYWLRIRPGISSDALESRLRHTLRPGTCGRWLWKFDLDGIAKAWLDSDPARQVDLWPSVEALRCPTLVVRGGASDFLPPATAAEMTVRNPLVHAVEIPGAGHYVHDDAPDAFHHELEHFLTSLEAAP
ncbi:alpha/beta fold hydrolase [Streptomyces ipomoeae]|uniref:Hydrolase, alpha/beta domain protein n=2 Tax=Streptomyces ipomoeae TaxID=103232 RepID=L1KJ07_9ACTN|nr:alpha/beta hydrolase [Streptomyces ipomoeae]EKX60373.1 hydrolase, alpha/beta domain protein [Streptomyces ipomoeae 91-03]MDX2693229.1 alpha/beta hydrolase [Streptomyces ipomoeae]MDX2838878.1 alpha/beta hydrolase [Streptomyces ipomoeae]TQE35374.1 alpha/beta hydrolase [Streptomyces ipomoeae]